MIRVPKQNYKKHFTNLNWVSAAILKKPERNNKGALILSMVDEVIPIFNNLKEFFYIIERRGWKGINNSQYADIKLVEDSSTLEETRRRFPQAILLDMAMGDFVDTEQFKPIETSKIYSAIQIASWADFKRHDLFLEAAALLPQHNFLKFGHFPKCSNEERALKKKIIRKSNASGASIEYPYASLRDNRDLPSSPEEINRYINSAKMGILTSSNEGMNRFKMECLSANVPFLVSTDSAYPIKKHLNTLTGIIYDPNPKGLVMAIQETLSKLDSFSPRKYILANTGKRNSIKKLEGALNQLVKRDGRNHYFTNLDFDGRNQSLFWGENAISLLEKYCWMGKIND